MSASTSWCVQCGPMVLIDQDGCCAMCGSSCMGDFADAANQLLAACEAALMAGIDCRNYGTPAPTIGCERDCHPCDVMRQVAAAIKMAKGSDDEAVSVGTENLGDLTGTKFGERLAKHAAKKARSL